MFVKLYEVDICLCSFAEVDSVKGQKLSRRWSRKV